MALIDSLKHYFGADNIIKVADREAIFCCFKKNSSDKVYQIIYVDCSGAWLRPGLETYFEEILSEQYYTSVGYLQWNFYYYFIADTDSILLNDEIKSIVEKDETFARKFVVTEAQLIARFQLAGTVGRTGGLLDGSDLYSEWLNYLRENELHFIYDDQNYPNYKTWVEQYIDGRPFPPQPDQQTPAAAQTAPRISSLQKLDIDNFRLHPSIRKFEFGRVNLISGANASGKTSFFDTLSRPEFG